MNITKVYLKRALNNLRNAKQAFPSKTLETIYNPTELANIKSYYQDTIRQVADLAREWC